LIFCKSYFFAVPKTYRDATATVDKNDWPADATLRDSRISIHKAAGMYQTLCEAIRSRSVLRLSMRNGECRVVEPHRYGARSNGNEVLNAFQRAAAGTEQLPMALKSVAVSEIESATATGETFTSPRPGYNPAGDQRIPAVFAEL
jgi:hypothetical protein